MFNAVNGLGGGGQVDADPANKGNIALNCTFAITSFFSGTSACQFVWVCGRGGARLTPRERSQSTTVWGHD